MHPLMHSPYAKTHCMLSCLVAPSIGIIRLSTVDSIGTTSDTGGGGGGDNDIITTRTVPSSNSAKSYNMYFVKTIIIHVAFIL